MQSVRRTGCKEMQSIKLGTRGWYMMWYEIYDVIWYDIYWLQLGFDQLAVVGKFVQNWERDSCIQKEEQYTEQYQNTEYSK